MNSIHLILPLGYELSWDPRLTGHPRAFVHYTDDFLLTGQDKQEMADTQEVLVRYTRSKGWEINPIEVQQFAMPVTF